MLKRPCGGTRGVTELRVNKKARDYIRWILQMTEVFIHNGWRDERQENLWTLPSLA